MTICLRPDNEWQLSPIFHEARSVPLNARGQGLSYSDCALLSDGWTIDTRRLNHLISFDSSTGIAACQGAVSFADLFSCHKEFIPPVIPGTLFATVAGGVANDVHGKNNVSQGCLGHHIEWLELQLGQTSYYCSAIKHQDLFYATIGGLGLTGVIKRLGIKLKKASSWVLTQTHTFSDHSTLLHHMQHEGVKFDHQVAWLDFLNKPRALLSVANHHPHSSSSTERLPLTRCVLPKMSLRVVNRWLIQQFNRLYFNSASSKSRHLPLWQFNNPLDALKNWNYLYGKQGLVQFQALFNTNNAEHIMHKLHSFIKDNRAYPTLAVLKYFTKPGSGLLSFVEPGFTLAIDFVNNQAAHQAIQAMNQYVAETGGKVYLAKDLFLNRLQFQRMYPNHEQFSNVLATYDSPMSSDLAKRIELTL